MRYLASILLDGKCSSWKIELDLDTFNFFFFGGGGLFHALALFHFGHPWCGARVGLLTWWSVEVVSNYPWDAGGCFLILHKFHF